MTPLSWALLSRSARELLRIFWSFKKRGQTIEVLSPSVGGRRHERRSPFLFMEGTIAEIMD